MKYLITLAVAAAMGGVCSAHAVVIDAKFSGAVTAQVNSGNALNAPVSGEFLYDTVSAKFLSFVIAGKSVASGFASATSMTPDQYSAFYVAQLSPVPNGGPNSTFSVDLEALSTAWPSNDAVALLGNASQLASNLDKTLSSFAYYTANADGTQVSSLTASLGSLQVTSVPEPETVTLMFAGLGLVGWAARRR